MKIVSIETYTTQQISIVRLRADNGAEGWGQLSPFNADISATVMHRQIAPHALGAPVADEAADIDALVERCVEANYKFPGTYIMRALAGLDTALWDMRGKMAGKSVCELLGGTPRPLDVYGSSMRRDLQPEQEAARLKSEQQCNGFRAFKIKVGKVCGHDMDQWPGRTEALLPVVRAAIGPEAEILVDANSCYTPLKAIRMAGLFADHGVRHYEEPCPWWQIEWTAEVARELEMPVTGGEQDWDLMQWRRIIDIHAIDVAQPDICYIGGLSRALQVAEWARQAGMPCIPHSANLSMVMVFSLHMMGAIANAGPHVECSIEPTPWTDGLYTPALEVQDGKVQIPNGPGWGVTPNPVWLAKAQYQKSQI